MARAERDDDLIDLSRTTDEVDELSDRLHPGVNRRQILEQLEKLFAGGSVPVPAPSGPLVGRLVGTTTWAPLDSGVTRLTGRWMPWLGKTFDPEQRSGVNRFLPTAPTRAALKAMFPRYPPERIRAGHIEAFPFRNWVGPGKLDRAQEVYKIDYDFEANPPLIRRILDELVEVAPGRYLGQALMRMGDRYHRVAYFALR